MTCELNIAGGVCVCVCFAIGGLVEVGGALFYSNAISKSKSRMDMTVLKSDTGGTSWPKGVLVYSGDAAYSALCETQNASEIGLAYEREWTDVKVAIGASSSIWWTTVPTDLPPYSHPPARDAV